MERTISQEERIRKAEEIYNRRRTNSRSGIRVSGKSVNSNKNKLSLFKKMGLQLAICSAIYIVFYLIRNTNYIFSEDIMLKTKEMLSYDINFGNVYSQVNNFFEENKNKLLSLDENNQEDESTKENDKNVQEQTSVDNGQNSEEDVNESNSNKNNIQIGNIVNEAQVGIGGAETNEVKEVSADETTKKTQMEIDAEYVKKNYSLKIPLKGTVTSRYGKRKATEIVSANHQGIDIGANTGTAIYAAMEGTVTLVSSEGDYRKTCGNNKWGCNDKICTL